MEFCQDFGILRPQMAQETDTVSQIREVRGSGVEANCGHTKSLKRFSDVFQSGVSDCMSAQDLRPRG